ncbi:MAG: hypothetical protein F6K19_23925, partial [Cyanothece sp. SIO1E1]|nr:hypothetical protein [Cyanothece sp. SIO1E1]
MPVAESQSYSYQVGGSLSPHASSYVERCADEQLFSALSCGDFCYVLNSRQMGKSSLRVRTTQRLQALGRQCGVIDITEIGSQNLTPDQWYASVALCLVNSFNLVIQLGEWWRERLHISPVKRLGAFVDQVLLTQVEDNIVLFIDEIDSVLSLGFSVEDFFALIRAWYNQRPESLAYQRLTLALFGVATPSELIADRQRTPFNVGKAIALNGFQMQEAQPLLPGLASICNNPEAILTQILAWTGGQPFLTQKLCQLISEEHGEKRRGGEGEKGRGGEREQEEQVSAPKLACQTSTASAGIRPQPMLPSLPPTYIDHLVQTRMLAKWEAQDEPEHLRTIRDYLLKSEYRAGRLLGLYQLILEQGSATLDGSSEQMELLLSGLVVKSGRKLTLQNRIYGAVFDLDWVHQQLGKLRPYADALKAWLQSDCRDESRLLRGQALQEAQAWSSLHSLSDGDYQFLTASQVLEQRQSQQRLQAERVQEAEARLVAETESARRQRWLLIVVSVGLVVASILGLTTFFQYRRAVASQRQAELREIEAIATSAAALLASHQSLDATVEAIRAMQRLQALANVDSVLQFQVTQV